MWQRGVGTPAVNGMFDVSLNNMSYPKQEVYCLEKQAVGLNLFRNIPAN
jgi:hypothetical protein